MSFRKQKTDKEECTYTTRYACCTPGPSPAPMLVDAAITDHKRVTRLNVFCYGNTVEFDQGPHHCPRCGTKAPGAEEILVMEELTRGADGNGEQ